MRTFTAILCLVGVVCGLSPEARANIKSHIKKAIEECKVEVTGVTDDDWASMKAHHLPTSQDGKCFIYCMNKKWGMQSADGKLNKETAYVAMEKMKSADEEMYTKMKQVADVCFAEVTDAADPCETAFKLLECFNKQDEVVGLKRICGLED